MARTLTRPLRKGYIDLLRKAQTLAPVTIPAVLVSTHLDPQQRRHLAAAHPSSTHSSSAADAPTYEDNGFNVFDTSDHAFLLYASDSSDSSSDTESETETLPNNASAT